MNSLELRIPPLALFIVFAIMIWAASAYLPAGNLALPERRFVAVIAFLLGFGIVSAESLNFAAGKRR